MNSGTKMQCGKGKVNFCVTLESTKGSARDVKKSIHRERWEVISMRSIGEGVFESNLAEWLSVEPRLGEKNKKSRKQARKP